MQTGCPKNFFLSPNRIFFYNTTKYSRILIIREFNRLARTYLHTYSEFFGNFYMIIPIVIVCPESSENKQFPFFLFVFYMITNQRFKTLNFQTKSCRFTYFSPLTILRQIIGFRGVIIVD